MSFPVLIDEVQLHRRIGELAAELDDADEVYLIAVLDGAVPFAEAICRRLGRASDDYDQIKVASYGRGTVSSGEVVLERDLEGDVRGRRIVLLEDIVDTGRTVQFLLDHLGRLGAASVEVCALLSKPSRRVIDVPVDFCGFEIPDEFVIGFGMDLDGQYRDLPHIAIWSHRSAAADA